MNMLVIDRNGSLSRLLKLRNPSAANAVVVETIDELIVQLKTGVFHGIAAPYWWDEDIDIWRLSRLLNSEQFSRYAVPIYLVKETCSFDVLEPFATAHNIILRTANAIGKLIHRSGCDDTMAEQEPGKDKLEAMKSTVLLVDDDKNMAEILSLALQSTYVVDVAYTGEEGFELWRKKRHHLILLDYMLPGINGDRTLDSIMQIDMHQPVIMLTGEHREELIIAMMLNGASDYLYKPVIIPTLLKRCKSVLAKSQLIYQNQDFDTKNARISNQVMALEEAIVQSDFLQARKALKTLKDLLPICYSEDDQIAYLAQQPKASC